MKIKTLLIIITSLLVVGAIIYLLSKNKSPERSFNHVILSEKNLVLSSDDFKYYDTILKVGLDQAKIENVIINVTKLSDASKNSFEGELKAHIRLHNGVYYLFIDKYSRSEAIKVISHEIIHIQQYESKDLVYDESTGVLIWKDQIIDLNTVPYDNRPWETDAFDRQSNLSNRVNDILYQH